MFPVRQASSSIFILLSRRLTQENAPLFIWWRLRKCSIAVLMCGSGGTPISPRRISGHTVAVYFGW